MFHLLTKLTRQFIARAARPLYCLIYGREREINVYTKLLRSVCSFFLGLLLAYLLWKLISLNFNLSSFFGGFPVSAIFVLLIALTFVISANVRTVTLLIFVALVGKSGRSYLRAVAFAYVISGPIDNLALNAGEVARLFACTTLLTYNLTKTRLDLMAKPFTNTLQHMKGDIEEIRISFMEIENILSNLKYAIERNNNDDEKLPSLGNNRQDGEANFAPRKASQIQATFLGHLKSRCKQQLRNGERVCQEIFRKGYTKCKTNFPDIVDTAICWPYRIDIICKLNIFGDPDKVCDASKVVPQDFGKAYVEMVRTEEELYYNSTNLGISYQLHNNTVQNNLRTAEQASEAFKKDFNRRKSVFDAIMKIIQKLLCLFLLQVVCASIRYFISYRGNVNFDNFYITDYFRHVDKRRRDKGKTIILPLRRYEKSSLVNVNSTCSRTSMESNTIIYYMLQFSLEIITAGIFLLLDRLLINILLIIRNRSLIHYRQEGEHEVRFHIKGSGLMARLMRTTMRNFNIHERVSTSLSNEECLPIVRELPLSYYIKLLSLYLVIIYLICESTTFLRLRRVICSYFFYKREKQRILFLYNRLLRERHFVFETQRKNAEENLDFQKIQENVNFCLRLRLRYPKAFGWMYSFKCAKRNCLICGTLEDHQFIVCSKCQLSYCRECSLELNSECISCKNSLLSNITESEKSSSNSSLDLYDYNGKHK